jgi:hypothetical protein
MAGLDPAIGINTMSKARERKTQPTMENRKLRQ